MTPCNTFCTLRAFRNDRVVWGSVEGVYLNHSIHLSACPFFFFFWLLLFLLFCPDDMFCAAEPSGTKRGLLVRNQTLPDDALLLNGVPCDEQCALSDSDVCLGACYLSGFRMAASLQWQTPSMASRRKDLESISAASSLTSRRRPSRPWNWNQPRDCNLARPLLRSSTWITGYHALDMLSEWLCRFEFWFWVGGTVLWKLHRVLWK